MDMHKELGLTDDEYGEICKILGREPNHTELAMFSVMWSEHCSYKSSRLHLKRLPSDAPYVILGPGENAGVIDIGDGLALVMRIESHNHPSYVEPYQGAATGVGGIIRDILTMGARPIASFDSLRFGLPTHEGPAAGGDSTGANEVIAAKNRWLARGVVSGISGYGNAVGVPTVGGEIQYDPCYSGNPLVNVLCLGVMPIDQLQRGAAAGVGNIGLLIGASTGRDGIGGVSVLASSGFDAQDTSKRPSVQVGDPFEEKKVIEACLELFERKLTVGMQDLGGAGLTCATAETAARANTGLRVNLDAVQLRESDMEPFEILTSESQERMFAIVEPGDVEEALAVCEKWETPVAVVGEVTADQSLVVQSQGRIVCDVPPAALDEGVVYDRPARRPERLDALLARDPNQDLPQITERDVPAQLVALMSSPNLADSSWAWRQYDHQLFLNTVMGPGSDAAVLRVKGTSRAIAVAIDGMGRYCRLDPRHGSELAVAEAARNVATVGARPVAMVDCLNFGNPESPEVMWEFSDAVDGIRTASLELALPVIGGNVSFYNETDGKAIDPTPIIGVVGLIGNLSAVPIGIGFRQAGDVIFVVGETGSDLGASEWAWWCHDFVGGSAPSMDYRAERHLHDFLIHIQSERLAASVHDVSLGGVATTLVECALASDLGCQVDAHAWAPQLGLSTALFSETSGRAVLSCVPSQVRAIQSAAHEAELPLWQIGEVSGSQVMGADVADLRAASLTHQL